MASILLSGLATLDCIYSVPAFSAAAQKFVAAEQQWAVGGGAANAALCVHRLGARAVLLSRTGNDLTGQLILSQLQQQGIDCSAILRVDGAQSAVSSILLDPHGERQIINFRGDLAESGTLQDNQITDLPGNQRFDAVLSDNRWQQGNEAALALAKSQGIPGVLDAEPPFSDTLTQLASHVAFSREGLQEISSTDDIEKGLHEANERLQAWVCVTDGERGVFSIENGKIRHCPAFPIKAVDTLGAGDVWHGAFCQQLAAGESEAGAIRFANAVAALKCMKKGGGSVTPTLGEVEKLLSEVE